MAQGGLIGCGVKVAFATNTSPYTWNKIELLLQVDLSSLTANKIDRTVHGSSPFKRNMAGMFEVSDLGLTMLRDPYLATSPNQNALFTHLAARTSLAWRVEVPADPDQATTLFEAYEFQGRVGSFVESAPVADKQTLKAMIVFDAAYFTHQYPYASVIG